jgi:hypothetical protein
MLHPSTVVILEDSSLRLGVAIHPEMAKTGLLGGTLERGRSCQFVTEEGHLSSAITFAIPQLLLVPWRGDLEAAAGIAVAMRRLSQKLRVAIVCPGTVSVPDAYRAVFDYRMSYGAHVSEDQSPGTVLRRFLEEAAPAR